jgi:hypothetical protein
MQVSSSFLRVNTSDCQKLEILSQSRLDAVGKVAQRVVYFKGVDNETLGYFLVRIYKFLIKIRL